MSTAEHAATAVRDGGATFISDDDVYLFNEGSHVRLADVLGAHPAELDGEPGVRFAVWAPSARAVSVIGDFNDWRPGVHRLHPRASSGIWQGFIPGLGAGERYKYRIESGHGYQVDKADPLALRAEEPPLTASVVWDLDYAWGDAEWMASRGARSRLDAPISIYELHPGSWRRMPEEGDRPLTYRELAPLLAEHVTRLGFTHVELLPIMEHPFYGSWGYQTTGYFAPTSRYGTPQDLMFLVDTLHQAGIGVILDWVPSHFPADEHGLGYFDGTHLYEHQDPREGHHKDWDSLIFNYGRHEVRSFLLSSALFWLDRYHVDGLRVDAVASMLYRDYSRKEGEWIPNEFGGRENLEAIGFLRRLNEEVFKHHPDVQTYAEESTAWPMVSRPTYVGGLGFGLKWDMGWMHDTLEYMRRDPIHRRHHHGELTFRAIYQFNENFVLPLSHDEVVHGKGSLLDRMPGDGWQKFANMRLLYGYMFTQPGKKLLFMGGEFGQGREWSHERSLDWHLREHPWHAGLEHLVSDLAHLYRDLPALHVGDCRPEGFEWIEAHDADESVVSYLRRAPDGRVAVVALNFTPIPRENHRLGVPTPGRWREVLNSDAERYGGGGIGNLGGADSVPVPGQGRPHSLVVTLPPLAALVFVPED
jgi:1,4-alpha-glucan branching enzyme